MTEGGKWLKGTEMQQLGSLQSWGETTLCNGAWSLVDLTTAEKWACPSLRFASLPIELALPLKYI